VVDHCGSISFCLLGGLPCLEVRLSDTELQATPDEVSPWPYTVL